MYILIKTRCNKFDDKSIKGILVGYAPNGYKIWNPENETYQITGDVIFHEINYLQGY